MNIALLNLEKSYTITTSRYHNFLYRRWATYLTAVEGESVTRDLPLTDGVYIGCISYHRTHRSAMQCFINSQIMPFYPIPWFGGHPINNHTRSNIILPYQCPLLCIVSFRDRPGLHNPVTSWAWSNHLLYSGHNFDILMNINSGKII